LDAALWQAAQTPLDDYRRITLVPFDHERRMTSALIDTPDGSRLIVVKGAPESVLARCVDLLGFQPLPIGFFAALAAAMSSLVGFGTPSATAVLAVVSWRLFEFWAPIPAGGLG
jgi:magnesium-transporting ATPase (P-type)